MVADILDPERSIDARRMTSVEFQKSKGLTSAQMDDLYGAAGSLVCPSHGSPSKMLPVASASIIASALTGRRDTLITAEHVFYDLDVPDAVCVTRDRFTDCRFDTTLGGMLVHLALSSEVARGTISCTGPLDGGDDWEILRLADPLPMLARPFLLTEVSDTTEGAVLAVAGYAADFYRDHEFPKTFSRCEFDMTVPAYRVLQQGTVTTDCSVSIGSSGAPILDDHRQVLGILKASWENAADIKENRRKPGLEYTVTCSFSLGNCASFVVPIAGAFHDALLAATAN